MRQTLIQPIGCKKAYDISGRELKMKTNFLPDGVVLTLTTALLMAESITFLFPPTGRDPGPRIPE